MRRRRWCSRRHCAATRTARPARSSPLSPRAGLAAARCSRSAAARMPLTKPGASAPQNSLATSTASSMAPSAGIGVSPGTASGWIISSSAITHDRLLQRRDAVDRPALGMALDHAVEVSGVVGGCVGQRPRELRGVALEEVVQLTAGDVVLVEGERGGAALIGAAGHASCRARRATCTPRSRSGSSRDRRC